jgi:hypothetical protein
MRISVLRGQRHLTVVVDHDTGLSLGAHVGRDTKTVEKSLDLLEDARSRRIRLMSCDMADWITIPIGLRSRTLRSAWTRST